MLVTCYVLLSICERRQQRVSRFPCPLPAELIPACGTLSRKKSPVAQVPDKWDIAQVYVTCRPLGRPAFTAVSRALQRVQGPSHSPGRILHGIFRVLGSRHRVVGIDLPVGSRISAQHCHVMASFFLFYQRGFQNVIMPTFRGDASNCYWKASIRFAQQYQPAAFVFLPFQSHADSR